MGETKMIAGVAFPQIAPEYAEYGQNDPEWRALTEPHGVFIVFYDWPRGSSSKRREIRGHHRPAMNRGTDLDTSPWRIAGAGGRGRPGFPRWLEFRPGN